EGRDRVFKNREMSILRREVPLAVGPDDFAPGAVDREQLRVLFNQLEFRSLLPRILEALGDGDTDESPAIAGFDVAVRRVHDPAEGKYLLDDLALRYLSVELRSPDAVEGTLDFDGDQESERTGRQAAALLMLVDKLREALEARELVELYERFERPLVRVLAR